jgi:hypothetical protein
MSDEAPDFSALPYELRVRVEVAVTQGAHWDEDGVLWNASGEWPLLHPPLGMLAVSGGRSHAIFLPDYLHDPAARQTLLERERIALVPWGEHFAAFDPDYWESNGEGVRAVGVALKGWHSGPPGPAICAAVLAKYGREVKP